MLDNLKKSFIEQSQADRLAEEAPVKATRFPELFDAVPFIMSVLASVHGASVEQEAQPTSANHVTASETEYVDTTNYVQATEPSFEDQARQLVNESETFFQANDQDTPSV